MNDLLYDLPLSAELKQTLTGTPTALSVGYLRSGTRPIGAADWGVSIQSSCERLGVELDKLLEVYLEALTFADGIDSFNV